MKILHINSYYSSSSFYRNLFEHQLRQGLDIDVYVPVSNKFEQPDFDFGFYTNLIKTHNEIDRLFHKIKHKKIYDDIKLRYNLRDYSLTHAHSLFSNGYISFRIFKDYGVPYVVAVRNTDLNVFFRRMVHLRNLGIEILKNASGVIFLSQAYRDAVINEYVPKDLRSDILQKSELIPNGIDDFWFDNIASPKKQPEKMELNMLQVGDICKNKNVETTIEACEILIGKSFKIKLNLVGKNKDKKISRIINNHDFVNYLGYKTKEELLSIYRQNHIFILPSRTETFGLVYAEAMSQGLPVIYTRGQGFDAQFDNGTVGYSVRHDDPDEIAVKIIDIIDNYQDISKKCVISVNKFRWNMIADRYKEIYHHICYVK